MNDPIKHLRAMLAIIEEIGGYMEPDRQGHIRDARAFVAAFDAMTPAQQRLWKSRYDEIAN